MQTDRLELQIAAKHTAIIRFLNPPHGFMDDGTESALRQALDRIGGDHAIRAVVLTGGLPGVFIRHYDVGLLESRARAMAARDLRFDTARPVPASPLHRMLDEIEASDRIFIAAINGTAMGGGFELALACDLRVARRGDYRIGLPETTIGLLPGAGGTQRLARAVGAARALEMILLGRTVGPEEATALGMVHHCVDGDLEAEALAIAARLAARPARALAHVKRLLHLDPARPLAQRLADERTLFCDLMVDGECIEAMARLNRGEIAIEGPALRATDLR